MTAKIIRLTNAKRGQIRCAENGVVFPQVFRLTGFNFRFKEGIDPKSTFIESLEDIEAALGSPVRPSYTLDMEKTYARIANPRWEPIHQLDPAIDDGVVYIRHHRTADRLDAYIDGIMDLESHDEYADSRFLSFETDFGYFTVLHRRPNEGAANHVLVYSTKVVDPTDMGLMDWHRVIGPDGKDLDIDDLDPPDVQEQFTAVQEMIREE